MSDSWTCPDLPGVVQKRANGKASSRWYYQGKNYRRTHPIPWDRKNRSLIKPLHRQFVAEIIGGSYEGRRRRELDRLSDAIDEFFQSQSKRLDEPPEGREAIMSTTARKYLMRIRSFCEWLVESGHLESSPMQGSLYPHERPTGRVSTTSSPRRR